MRFRNLPLFWKLLVPFLALMLLAGVLGSFVIVRDLSSRAETALDQDLSRRSLEAASLVHDRELYLLESVNFATNLRGMATAIRDRNVHRATGLLRSVFALKSDLSLLAVTEQNGIGLREYVSEGGKPQASGGTPWQTNDFVERAFNSSGERSSGFLRVGDHTILAIAGPVCSTVKGCTPVGVAIAGIDVTDLTAEALTETGRGARVGTSIYGLDGRLLAHSGIRKVPASTPAGVGNGSVRQTVGNGSDELASLYAPLEVQRRRVGTVAVTVPTAPAIASARAAGYRLVLILLAAMVGVMAIGAFLSRTILRQVRPLIETNRELEQGRFSARAPVLGTDELGQMAEGVNRMAEQLQTSYETLEQRVAERTADVRRLLKERTEFFASMSHQLRVPLAVILGQADMLVDPDYPRGRRFSTETGRTIKHSAAQLLAVVNDILDLAKAEAGDLEMEIEAVDLAAMIEDMRGTIEGLAHTASLTASIRIPSELPPVVADRMRLREVVLNLVDNAVKYTPEGGRFTVSASSAYDVVEISVEDTGVGIPAGDAEHIFEPFYQVKGTKPQSGQPSSGLGLAVTKLLLQAMGGEISFASRKKKGSVFTITLTAANPPPLASPDIEPAAFAGTPASRSRP